MSNEDWGRLVQLVSLSLCGTYLLLAAGPLWREIRRVVRANRRGR